MWVVFEMLLPDGSMPGAVRGRTTKEQAMELAVACAVENGADEAECKESLEDDEAWMSDDGCYTVYLAEVEMGN